MSSVWVIMPNHGYEGLGEPVGAWLSEEKARAALALIKRSSLCQQMDLIEVAIEDAPDAVA